MPTIYVVNQSLSTLVIQEAELLKKTAEQLRIDPRSVKVVWKDSQQSYSPYLSSRLSRHRIAWFETFPQAVERAKELILKDIERSKINLERSQQAFINLTVFSLDQFDKEEAKDNAR